MKRLIAVLVGAVAWVPALEAQLPPVNPAAYRMASSPSFCLDIGDGYPIQATCNVNPDESQVWTLSDTVVGDYTTLSSGTACLTADTTSTPPTPTLTECSSTPSDGQLWQLYRQSSSRTYRVYWSPDGESTYCLASPSSEEGAQLTTYACPDVGTTYGWVTYQPPTDPVNPAAYQMASSPSFCLDIGNGYPIQATCNQNPDASQVWTLSNTVVGEPTTLSSGTSCLTVDPTSNWPPPPTLTECSSPPSNLQVWQLLRLASRTYQVQWNDNQGDYFCLASSGSEEGAQLFTYDCSNDQTDYGWVTNQPSTEGE